MNKLTICRNITTKTQLFYFKNPLTCYSPEIIPEKPIKGALKGWSTIVDGKKPTFSFGRWMREATMEEKKDPKLRLNAVTQFLKSVR